MNADPRNDAPPGEPPTVGATPAPGQFAALAVPGYDVIEEIGRGGMGVVYKVRQASLGRVVALKMILAGSQAGEEERLRFLAEARAAAELDHPGIVKVHEFGTHAGLGYCVQEYCEGGNLAKKLGGAPLQAAEAARVVEQVARAVQAAHERKIIHRDLKPANVLIAADGGYKVADFGLAKRLESGADVTQSGAIMGTPSYVSPEQARGQKDVGPAADVYSLGAIFYECLTGRPPFLAANTFDTLAQVINDDPVPPRRLQPRLPRDLETICLKCLHKEPARRYASAAELADDLARYLAGEAIRARPVGPAERAVKWVRRRPVAAILSFVTALALAATLALLVVAVVTQQRQHQIELSRRLEEQRREDAERYAAQMQAVLAISVVRSLSTTEQDRLPAGAVETLEDLARFPPPARARMVILEQATSDAFAGRRLAGLLRPLLRALIGLDRELRDELIERWSERLEEGSAPPACRLLVARGLVQLGQGEGEKGRQALATLVRVAATEAGPEPRDGDRCLADLLEASHSFDAPAAGAAAEAIAEHFPAVKRPDVAHGLAAVFERASKTMPPDQANRLAARLCATLLPQLPKLTVSPEAKEWDWVRAFRLVAGSLDRRSADEVLTALLRMSTDEAGSPVLEAASSVFDRLTAPPPERRSAAGKHFALKGVARLKEARGTQAGSVARMVTWSAPHLAREDGAAVARALGQVMKAVEHADQHRAAIEMAKALLPALAQEEAAGLLEQSVGMADRGARAIRKDDRAFEILKLNVAVSALVLGCAALPKERQAGVTKALVEALLKTQTYEGADLFTASEVARALGVVAGKLGGAEAPEALAALTVRVVRSVPPSDERYEYYLDVTTLEAAARRMDEAQAKALVAEVSKLVGPNSQGGQLWVLAAACAAASGRAPGESVAVRKNLLAALEREAGREKRPGFRLYLARGLNALGDEKDTSARGTALSLARRVVEKQKEKKAPRERGAEEQSTTLRIRAGTLGNLRRLLSGKDRDEL